VRGLLLRRGCAAGGWTWSGLLRRRWANSCATAGPRPDVRTHTDVQAAPFMVSLELSQCIGCKLPKFRQEGQKFKLRCRAISVDGAQLPQGTVVCATCANQCWGRRPCAAEAGSLAQLSAASLPVACRDHAQQARQLTHMTHKTRCFSTPPYQCGSNTGVYVRCVVGCERLSG
jgi:hypothetical protein